LLLAVACTTASNVPTPNCTVPPSRVRFGAGGAELHVQVAADDDARQRGLMGVTDLPPDEGMAFTWDAPTTATFWMKDTLIPLAIAFVGPDGRIDTITEMTPCENDPCRTYASDAPYTMAIESNAGWYTDNDVAVGDRVRLIEAFCS
jgi:uncharacterized membrane protein (UPF0127 family)